MNSLLEPVMIRPSLVEDATPEAFAEAMIQCQGYAPACSDAKECLNEGACFTSAGRGYASAHKALEAIILKTDNPHVRSWLCIARNAMEHYRTVSTVR